MVFFSNIFPMVFGESETFVSRSVSSKHSSHRSFGGPGVIGLSWGGWTPEQIQGGAPTIYKWRDMGTPINGLIHGFSWGYKLKPYLYGIYRGPPCTIYVWYSLTYIGWFSWLFMSETKTRPVSGDGFLVMATHNSWLRSAFVIDWWSCFLGFLLFKVIFVNTPQAASPRSVCKVCRVNSFNPAFHQDQFKVGLQIVESNGIQNGFQVGQIRDSDVFFFSVGKSQTGVRITG